MGRAAQSAAEPGPRGATPAPPRLRPAPNFRSYSDFGERGWNTARTIRRRLSPQLSPGVGGEEKRMLLRIGSEQPLDAAVSRPGRCEELVVARSGKAPRPHDAAVDLDRKR